MSCDNQQLKLSTINCKFCDDRLSGDKDFQAYHYYLVHPDKIKKCFERGYPNLPLKTRTKYRTMENAWRDTLLRLELIHEREKTLI